MSVPSPYSWEDRLPEGVEILERFVDTSGMDAFYLVKVSYASEKDVVEICSEFQLLQYQGPQRLGVAGIIDERIGIAWFPLSSTDRIYQYCSVDSNGNLKPKVNGRFVNMLWVDDESKELIIQVAFM